MWILPAGLRKRSANVGGSLVCPWCSSPKLKKVDHYPPDRDVYRCKMCGCKLTYITAPMAVDAPERMIQTRAKSTYFKKVPLIGKRFIQRLKKIPIIGK